MAESHTILDAAAIKRAIKRIAQQVVEANGGVGELVIVGLHTQGVFIAQRLAAAIGEFEKVNVPLGTMDITLYRDDVGMRASGPALPVRGGTDIPFDITGKTVVLVDDVLHTGRSIRAALDQLMDLGRPRIIQLVGLVDRGGRELPIRPDFVAREVTIAADEDVSVRLDGPEDEAVIIRKEP
jgi:pyrimidine operon attenuation protein/uracil phosphoribosyltransferase